MKIKKIGAAVCALAIGLSISGCADTTWVLKNDKITLPTGVYNYFLVTDANYVTQMAAASSASSKVWSQTVSGSNAATWAKKSALDYCKQTAVIEKLSAEKKISVTSSNSSAAASAASSSYDQISAICSKNGISETSLERIMKDWNYLRTDLFKSYYGTNGDKSVPEKTVESYYAKNYVQIKQIFIAKINLKTNKALTDKKKLAAQKKKAQTSFKAASSDIAHFDKYMKKYSEDTGLKAYPNGYIFSKATSTNYDTKFTSLAFSLKVGQVKMTESDMGYFIEYRVALDPKKISSSDKKVVTETVNSTAFSKMITDTAKKEKFTVNQSTIDKFDPTKVDLTTSS